MNLPPTLTCSAFPRSLESGRHKYAAGGLEESWIANSMYGCAEACCESEYGGAVNGESGGLGETTAVEGGEVMVNPHACGTEGMWTSSHWPGRW